MATAPAFSPPPVTGGIGRWVQTAFVLVGAIGAWLLHQIAMTVWELFQEPNKYVVIAIAFFGGCAIGVAGYRNEKSRELASDVVTELQRVTWPTRKETVTATIVVIITSVLASILLGAFDALWSFLTDTIYLGS